MTENSGYLTDQLITYIGNKRALLPFIAQGISFVQNKLEKEKLDCLDIFSGSGIVSRFLKQYSHTITANDLELYARIISACYLSDPSAPEMKTLCSLYSEVTEKTEELLAQSMQHRTVPGFITELYAPENELHILPGERCFYTPRNARYIDIARQIIGSTVPEQMQPYFIAPLLAQASVHANTSGLFKGFYKNSETGAGQFGGNGKNALSRITGDITLPFPVFSAFHCPARIFCKDANALASDAGLYTDLSGGSFDLAYIDPPYNQHPYGSNYFMLNLIASYNRPDTTELSRVSGIPPCWNRSVYNKHAQAEKAFRNLVQTVHAKYLLVSFNSEGFIPREEMVSILEETGTVTVLREQYNTFRGSRNLRQRSIHLSEFLYIVQKKHFI